MMKKEREYRFAALVALLLGAVVPLAGCESQGPAEKAGAKIDAGVQKAKDTVMPPGPAEKAGRAADKALNP